MRRPFSFGEGRGVRSALMVLALASGAGLPAGAPAEAAMRGYIVTNFDSIRIEAPVRVVLTTGSGVSGSGEGDRETLNRVRLAVSGSTLTVRMDDAPQGLSDSAATEAPTLYLSTSQLRRVTVMGGAVLTISELSGLEADLSMNGSGEMLVDRVDVERLTLYVGGGGKMTVKGNARALQASVNGPGMLDAAGLTARDASIANDGVGSVQATVNGPAKVVSTGSGDTVVGGNPSCTITRRGVGKVVCGS